MESLDLFFNYIFIRGLMLSSCQLSKHEAASTTTPPRRNRAHQQSTGHHYEQEMSSEMSSKKSLVDHKGASSLLLKPCIIYHLHCGGS